VQRASLAAAAALAIAAGGAAQAAPAPSPGALTPQAGPAPLPPTPYAVPQPSLAPAVPSGAPATPLAGAALTLTNVAIEADPHAGAARARRGWRPPASTADSIGLELTPGEAMDGAWIRRQFALNGLVGSPTTSDRVVALVLLINQAYAHSGYINTGLVFPTQDWAAGGTLRLRLISGGLGRDARSRPDVTVAWGPGGPRGLRARFIRDRLPSATRIPLNVTDLEYDFRLLADNPALETVNAQLVPGAAPGEASLALTVAPQPRFDVYSGVANSRNPSVGPIRFFAGGSMRNLAFSGDLVSVDVGETSGLTDAVVDYATPFLAPWLTADVQGLYDDAAVVDPSVRALDIRSTETSVEGGLTARVLAQPLTPQANGQGWNAAQTLDFGVRVAQRHSSSSLLGVPFSFSPGAVNGVTDLTVLRFTGSYVRRSQDSAVAISATLSTGLAGTGSDIAGVAKPDPHFVTALVQANYARKLVAGLELHARLTGQWSDSLLYAMERLSAGGADTVRGYRENLLLADEGAIGSVELACPVTVGKPFCGTTTDWTTVRVSVFADGAWLHDRVPPQPAPSGIASVGASAVWNPDGVLAARLTYGYALVHAVQTGPEDLQDRGLSFSVTVHPLQLIPGLR
jgi:hemolysin activation/secretion protein